MSPTPLVDRPSVDVDHLDRTDDEAADLRFDIRPSRPRPSGAVLVGSPLQHGRLEGVVVEILRAVEHQDARTVAEPQTADGPFLGPTWSQTLTTTIKPVWSSCTISVRPLLKRKRVWGRSISGRGQPLRLECRRRHVAGRKCPAREPKQSFPEGHPWHLSQAGQWDVRKAA